MLMLACGPETPAVTYLPAGVESPQEPPPPAGEDPTHPPSVEPRPPPPVVVPAPPPPTVPTGRSWYVSLQGSDRAAGTRAAPLRTVGRAVALARPGEVIRV
ncbi:MAG TPA: DUF1565 domain-containing protein, partial [Myxococcaceae bacterium]|nr:DUF1565 domain-containing protein [Myxococcaceae bacterium]